MFNLSQKNDRPPLNHMSTDISLRSQVANGTPPTANNLAWLRRAGHHRIVREYRRVFRDRGSGWTGNAGRLFFDRSTIPAPEQCEIVDEFDARMGLPLHHSVQSLRILMFHRFGELGPGPCLVRSGTPAAAEQLEASDAQKR